MPLVHTREVIICGWRPGQGRLTGLLGALLLGGHDPTTGELLYLGDVGSGFSETERHRLQARLDDLQIPQHPFAVPPPREDMLRAHWVRPVLVGEVRYRQFTRGAGRLRHTRWRGLRADRDPDDVLAPASIGGGPNAGAPATPAAARSSTSTPGAAGGQRITVQINGKQLTLSNLDKVLYPADGYSKDEVINYYTRVAPVLLPHVRGRPITVVRWPEGVDGPRWFGKNVPAGAPCWLPTVRLSQSGSRSSGEVIDRPLVDDLPSLVWVANLAALELHVPQWTVAPNGERCLPGRLVIDLDPGEGTTIVECCRVAQRLREHLVADGLAPFPTTSGSKGMQLYASTTVDRADAASAYAKQLAQRLARETPYTVTAVMAKARRAGKVFIDWSQNNPAKTTITPYSLRGRDHPTAATPITWEEVAACRRPSQLSFTADDVLARLVGLGDLLADLDSTGAPPVLPGS
ncbi:MAG TPA: non-homologous end-joining DNA ligase [Pseudonocardiaceae bacterium]|nr:non-homologous end-joining DNA ligase [Pseudonocardiaceae bacterium]